MQDKPLVRLVACTTLHRKTPSSAKVETMHERASCWRVSTRDNFSLNSVGYGTSNQLRLGMVSNAGHRRSRYYAQLEICSDTRQPHGGASMCLVSSRREAPEEAGCICCQTILFLTTAKVDR